MEPASSSQPLGGRRSCRVCSDEEDVFSQMRRTMYAEARKKDKKQPSQPPATPTRESTQPNDSQHATTSTAVTPPTRPPPPAAASPTASTFTSLPPLLAAGRPLPCPPDATRLGRSTWTFLHSMAAYYPTAASPPQQQHAAGLLHSLTSLYPCPHCAAHLSSYYHTHPPEQYVNGREQLSGYLCRVHNDVRVRQGKRVFDCGRVLERWGGHDWENRHDDTTCDQREYGDVEDEEQEVTG